jgi:hypothetical protein
MAVEPGPAEKNPPRDFGSLARRIANYTTRGILCAGVVVAGIVFGRQVMLWWGVESLPLGGTNAETALDALGDPGRPHTIEFGDSPWSLRRESFSGDKQQATQRLLAVCRAAAENTAGQASIGTPLPAERKMLASLVGRKPADESPGTWRLYELHDAFPMIVGVARMNVRASAAPAAKKKEKNLAEEPYRLVLWGIGMPSSGTGWTLCVFEPGGSASAQGQTDVPLPPGCHRTLSIRVAEGGQMTTFAGPEQPEAWKQFFADWSQRRGWPSAWGWRQTGGVWVAKFASADRGDSLDVRLGPDARGQWTGLLMVVLRRPSP